MTQEEFVEILESKNYSYRLDGGVIKVNHDDSVDLDSLTALPERVRFENNGGVYLDSLTAMPERVRFENNGGVYLYSLTAMPERVSFKNGGSVYLSDLTAMPERVRFENNGGVYLDSLTAMPERVSFKNGGSVYLSDLTAMPERVRFENGGSVYLSALSGTTQKHRGKSIRLEVVDGYTMIVNSERTMGQYLIMRCQYFGGGEISRLRPCYVARRGDFTAHGDTIKAAIRDVEFKKLQSQSDLTDIIEEVKSTQRVTFNQFRLLTGACESGLILGMKQVGLDPTTEYLPLTTVMESAHGEYGDKFKSLFT